MPFYGLTSDPLGCFRFQSFGRLILTLPWIVCVVVAIRSFRPLNSLKNQVCYRLHLWTDFPFNLKGKEQEKSEMRKTTTLGLLTLTVHHAYSQEKWIAYPLLSRTLSLGLYILNSCERSHE